MAVDFVIDDADTLFYDFDAFGHVLNAAQFIGPIIDAREKAYNRTIKNGACSAPPLFCRQSRNLRSRYSAGQDLCLP